MHYKLLKIVIIMLLGIIIFTYQINAQVIIVATNSQQDGFVRRGLVNWDNVTVRVGDDQTAGGVPIYGFMGFPLNLIPPQSANVVITSATLFIRNRGPQGTPNLTAPVKVSHVDFSNSLDYGDTNAGAILEADFYQFYPIPDAWNAIPCTAQVANAYSNAKSWKVDNVSNWFQIRYSPSNIVANGLDDYFRFNSADQGGTSRPYLKVRFYSPSCSDRDIIMYVDPNGSDTPPYDTLASAAIKIQTAINYIIPANCNDIDLVAQNNRVIIYVNNGVYDEDVEIPDDFTTDATHNITLRNLPGATPELVGSANPTIYNNFTIRESYTVLQGFHIHDITRKTNDGEWEGSPIYIDDNTADYVTIRSNYMYNMTLEANILDEEGYGYYIYVDAPNTGVIIEGNRLDLDFLNVDGMLVDANESIVRNNTINGGPGLSPLGLKMEDGTDLQFSGNILNDLSTGLRMKRVNNAYIYSNYANNCSTGLEVKVQGDWAPHSWSGVYIYGNVGIGGGTLIFVDSRGVSDDSVGQNTLSDIYIYNNLSLRQNIPIRLEASGYQNILEDVHVYNNLIWKPVHIGIELLAGRTNDGGNEDSVLRNSYIYNNTIYNTGGANTDETNADGFFRAGIGMQEVDQGTGGTIESISIYNNLITHTKGIAVCRQLTANKSGPSTPGFSSSPDYNCTYLNLNDNNTAWGVNNLIADPRYVSTTEGDPYNLRLGLTSPCIDRGDNTGPANDYWYEARPYDLTTAANYNGFYDIGADEVYANLYVQKEIENVTLAVTNTNTGLIEAMPGATITYKLIYLNALSFSVNGVIMQDNIPNGTAYKTNSLRKSPVSSNYNSASNLTDIGDDGDIGSYAGGSIYFTPDNGNSPSIGGTISSGADGALYFQAYVLDTLQVNDLVINSGTMSGANFAPDIIGNQQVTAATLWGGRFASIPDSAGLVGTNFIPISLTNKGTLPEINYALFITDTNYNTAPALWDISIVPEGSTTPVIGSVTIPQGGVTNFRIMIVADLTLANGSYLEFQLMAQPMPITSATSYIGDDGKEYGGDIGEDWDGNVGPAYYGQIYPQTSAVQPNSVTRFTIMQLDIRITKQRISPVGPAVVGQDITYRVDYYNAGAIIASGVKIIDPVPYGTEFRMGSLWHNGTNELTEDLDDDAASCDGSEFVFAVNNGLAPGIGGTLAPDESGFMLYSVTVLRTNYTPTATHTIKLDENTGTGEFNSVITWTIASGCTDRWDDTDFLYVGDRSDCLVKSLISFDMPSVLLSSNIVITAATLIIVSSGQTGDNQAVVSPLHIDLAELGVAAERADHDAPVYMSDMAFFTPPYPSAGFSNLISVKSGMQSTVNNLRPRFQIVIRPNGIDIDGGVSDDWDFYAFNQAGDEAYWPEILVSYYTNVISDPVSSVTNSLCISGDNFTNICTNVVTPVTQFFGDFVMSKTQVSPVGEPQFGDYVRYRIDYSNAGLGPANSVVIVDPIPTGTMYSQESMYWDAVGSLSDSPNNDAGYFDGSQVMFAVDWGQAPAIGGNVAPGAFGSVYYTLRIEDRPTGYGVTNSVTLDWSTGGWDADIDENGLDGHDDDNDIGDRSDNSETRMLLSLDMPSELMNNPWLVVTAATLFLTSHDWQNSDQGTINPIHIDLVDLGSLLDPADYDGGTVFSSNIATFDGIDTAADHNTFTNYNLDIANAMQDTMDNARSRFQVRLRPDDITDTDNNDDHLEVCSLDHATPAYRPSVTVYYTTNYPGPPMNINNIACAELQGITTTCATASTTVGGVPQIQIFKTNITGNPLQAGSSMRYRINYTNAGGWATNVTITDIIPKHTTYVAGSMDDAGGFVSDAEGDDEGLYDGTRIEYRPNGNAQGIPGGLDANQAGFIEFTVNINNSSIAGTTPTSCMNVSYQGGSWDGQVTSDGGTDSGNTTMIVGDIKTGDAEIRAVISFSLPPEITADTNVIITSATLFYRIDVASFSGPSPDPDVIRPFHFDVIDAGGGISPADYNSPAIITNFHVTAANIINPNNYTVDVTTELGTVLNASMSDFQIRIRPEAITIDATDDGYDIASFDHGTTNVRPTLYICYATNFAAIDMNGMDITNKAIISITAPINYSTNSTEVTKVTQTPSMVMINKTNVTINPVAGGYLTYRIDYTNAGGTAMDVIITDIISNINNVVYVSNSISNSLGSNFSDDVDDDEGSYSESMGLVFCIGGGTSPETGGTISAGASGSLFYTVQVASNTDAVTNVADLSTAFTATSSTLVVVMTTPGIATLQISKSISNVMLDGLPVSKPVPGAMVIYKIIYSNAGPGAALNMLIYDQIPGITVYYTNDMGTEPGWTDQYSTNTSPPDQSWGSANYMNGPPGVAVKSNVSWIRWRKPNVPAGEVGTFTYQVIIK